MDADQDQGVKSDGKQIQIRRGIRWKLLTSMIGLIAVLLAILTSLQVSGQKQTQERALERRIALMKKVLNQRGHTLADNLKRQAENDIASFNFSNISELIHKAVREDEELSYAILMDTSRTAYIHTLDAKQEQETLDEPEDRFAAHQAAPRINEYSKRTRSFMEFIQPIRIGTEQWGVLRLGFSLDTLNQEIVHSRAENFQQIQSMAFRSIGTAIVFVLLGVLMVAWISTRISTPLWNLPESANELAKGDFSAADNIQIRSQDELGVLARAFVEMSRQLRVSYERLEDYSKTLEQKVDERTHELAVTQDVTILSMASLAETRDNETGGHSLRVALYAQEVAQKLGLDSEKVDAVFKGSLLHDIGKIGIPDSVLLKPGKLDDDEWVVMRSHVAMGYSLLKGIDFLQEVSLVPLFHHERFDGTGYMLGLKDDEIPIGARIFAVADTYDAITSDRPYRKGMSDEEARAEIKAVSGTQLDPGVAEAFAAVPAEVILAIREVKTDATQRDEAGVPDPVVVLQGAFDALKASGVL